jgi:lipopolysaccharide/colanic/teichoic acid biosynthesis glycosyltransferase/GGDEF domain-containing protein
MSIFTTYQRLYKNGHAFDPITSLGGIYSQKEFRIILERERARVERNSHYFTLTVFHLAAMKNKLSRIISVIRLLKTRIRMTDVVGWLDDDNVGVFMPETPRDGGHRFAQDIILTLSKTKIPVKYRILTYPSPDGKDTLPSGTEEPDKDKTPESRAGLVTDSLPENVYPLSRNTLRQMNHDMENTHRKDMPDLADVYARPPQFWKRALDVCGAAIGLFLLSPLFLCISLLIKLVSQGPAFYRQERIGYKGKPFKMYKFRTMHLGADTVVHQNYLQSLIRSDDPMTKLDDKKDPRIIPFGHLLRRTSLDELPQLLNVLIGEMSLIGPRPCLPYEAKDFDLWYNRRFDVLPGMTGSWQVNGKNKTTFKEMMRLDVSYSRKSSFSQDTKILLKTVPAIVEQIWGGR